MPLKPLALAILLLIAFSKPPHTIEGGFKPISHVKPLKPLTAPVLKPQAELSTIYIAPPAPVIGCGSDPNMAFIYEHESGCSTVSINAYSGACGLGQALPCSKLPCSLSDWSCQNAYFTSYAVGRYGSTYAAMLYWEAHSWW